jgi:hypothetical protein
MADVSRDVLYYHPEVADILIRGSYFPPLEHQRPSPLLSGSNAYTPILRIYKHGGVLVEVVIDK